MEISNNISVNQPSNSSALPIAEINEAKATSEIFFDGNSTFYALNEHEFNTLKRGGNNSWKELTIAAIGLFLPFVLNTISEGNKLKWEVASWDLFFNSLFSFTSLLLIIIFGLAWINSKNETDEIIERIEKKPKFRI